MRLVAVCLSLPLVVGAGVVAAQQPQAGAGAAKQADAQGTHAVASKQKTTHHTKKHVKTSSHKGKRPAYRPEYGENSVEVINGDATKKIVFHDEQAAATTKSATKAMKNAPPPPLKVEVMNGGSTDTQYFSRSGQDEQMAAARNRPVVIGVESSNTRTAGGNKHPVVTSVNSAGTVDATPASGGQPAANTVSPHPKRPVYQPDVH